MAFRSRVETLTQPIGQSAKTCFEKMMSTKETSVRAVQPIPIVAGAPIRFFDDRTSYIRDQLENNGDGTGRTIFRPKCIAIGPRFHGDKGLEHGEEIKRIAAWDFWECSDQPFSALYARVEAVVGETRASYSSSTASFSDEDFTTMMFIDGCFLLQLIVLHNIRDGGVLTDSDDLSSALHQVGITTFLEDIFVVENQIPWVVLQALMAIRPVQVINFIDTRIAIWFDKQSARPDHQHGIGRSANDYGPIHLLDLLCKRQIGHASPLTDEQIYTYGKLEVVVALTSVTELAEAGVNICPSDTPRFADVHFWWRWPVFGCLSLPPLIIRQRTMLLLLNMLAFELFYWDKRDNRSNVAAYFGILSTLMSTEEDLRQLRRKGIIQTTLSDKEVMKFFKKLEPHTCWNNAIITTHLLRATINNFFKRQRLWIDVHRFVYNNFKFLFAIGSFLSVSLSILKAILSLQGSSNAGPVAGH
uniref:Uncharacterized protein n=1 Tax=Avena sativa TaxID=4498 RepID=A0ACD5VAZ1_AVESA